MVPFLIPRTTSVLAEIGDFSIWAGGGLPSDAACAGPSRLSAAMAGMPAIRMERDLMRILPCSAEGMLLGRDCRPATALWRIQPKILAEFPIHLLAQ
jgi:hypothetical protein